MAEFYSIEPKSRNDLRELAMIFREEVGLEDCIYFPIVEYMEQMMPKLFPNFNYEIVPDEDLPKNKHATTEIDIVNNTGTVKIKQSVYDGACEGNGQHRMTIAHEVIGHFIPLCVMGFKLSRSFETDDVPAFRDPEWQAKCLAGEFMIPKHLVKDYSIDQIVKECGVSKLAAKTQRMAFVKEARKSCKKNTKNTESK